jgi:hypothetical protein
VWLHRQGDPGGRGWELMDCRCGFESGKMVEGEREGGRDMREPGTDATINPVSAGMSDSRARSDRPRNANRNSADGRRAATCRLTDKGIRTNRQGERGVQQGWHLAAALGR